MSRRPRLLRRALITAPLALVVLLAVEALITLRRQYAPVPGYTVQGQADGRAPAVRMAMLGDSTVAGLGADTAEESLAVQTAHRVARATGRRVEVRGHGVSGATTADVRDDQLPRVAGEPLDVVVIVIESNDVTHATPPWRFHDDTAAMLQEARRLLPDSAVVLGGIPLFDSATAFPQPLRAVVDGYAGILRSRQRGAAAAQDGVTYVDIAAEASPRFVGVPEAMADGFHPSAVGYGFWADALAEGVVAALNDG